MVSLRGVAADEEKVADVKKLLTSGAFYFAWSVHGSIVDLTLSAQKADRSTDGNPDNRYYSRSYLLIYLA